MTQVIKCNGCGGIVDEASATLTLYDESTGGLQNKVDLCTVCRNDVEEFLGV